jgi:hypothetical protein
MSDLAEIDDLLDRIEVPPLDPEADVVRGRSALRRRHRLQVAGAALSVGALAAIGVTVQGASWVSGASDPSYLNRTPARFLSPDSSSPGSIHRPPNETDERVRELQHRLTDVTTQRTLQRYRDVIAQHLGPGGDQLRVTQDEEGGSGSFGTKMDWRHGGMLEIVVGSRWDAAGGSYPLEYAAMRPTTYDGRPARVSTAGDDLVVSVRHTDGTVVTLLASTSFGNNHTSTPHLDLTQPQLLAAAADERLDLPYYLR